jgi:hypothetical protein
MKKIIGLFCLLFICAKTFAQSIIYKDVVEISKQQFDLHLPAIWLTCESIRVKPGHQIVIKTFKRTIVLKDDCDMTRPPLTLIHEIEPNTEEWYFINRQTATIDTLVGNPVFYPNSMMVACLEGQVPDQKQRIQTGQIIKGRLITNFRFTLKAGVHAEDVYWFDKHTLFLNDDNEKFYKLTF